MERCAAYLNFLLAKRDLADDFQACSLGGLGVLEILGLEHVLVFLAAVCRGQRRWGGGGSLARGVVGRIAPGGRSRTNQRASNMGHEQMEAEPFEELTTYLVRLRFWRARALLSTSGGMWFATLSCAWTRKANWPLKLARLAGGRRDDAGDEKAGRGDERAMDARAAPVGGVCEIKRRGTCAEGVERSTRAVNMVAGKGK